MDKGTDTVQNFLIVVKIQRMKDRKMWCNSLNAGIIENNLHISRIQFQYHFHV